MKLYERYGYKIVFFRNMWIVRNRFGTILSEHISEANAQRRARELAEDDVRDDQNDNPQWDSSRGIR